MAGASISSATVASHVTAIAPRKVPILPRKAIHAILDRAQPLMCFHCSTRRSWRFCAGPSRPPYGRPKRTDRDEASSMGLESRPPFRPLRSRRPSLPIYCVRPHAIVPIPHIKDQT